MAAQGAPAAVGKIRPIERHNSVALLSTAAGKCAGFELYVNLLANCQLTFCLSAEPEVHTDHQIELWNSMVYEANVQPPRLRGTVAGVEVVISEAVIRTVLGLGDNPLSPDVFPDKVIQGCFRRMGYTGDLSAVNYLKARLPSKFRFIMHSIIMSLSQQRGGYDTMDRRGLSLMIGLIFNKPFNYSLYLFRNMIGNQANVARGTHFNMYPRFVQLMLNFLAPELNNNYLGAILPIQRIGSRIFADCKCDLVDPQPCGRIVAQDYQWPGDDHFDHLLTENPAAPIILTAGHKRKKSAGTSTSGPVIQASAAPVISQVPAVQVTAPVVSVVPASVVTTPVVTEVVPPLISSVATSSVPSSSAIITTEEVPPPTSGVASSPVATNVVLAESTGFQVPVLESVTASESTSLADLSYFTDFRAEQAHLIEQLKAGTISVEEYYAALRTVEDTVDLATSVAFSDTVHVEDIPVKSTETSEAQAKERAKGKRKFIAKPRKTPPPPPHQLPLPQSPPRTPLNLSIEDSDSDSDQDNSPLSKRVRFSVSPPATTSIPVTVPATVLQQQLPLPRTTTTTFSTISSSVRALTQPETSQSTPSASTFSAGQQFSNFEMIRLMREMELKMIKMQSDMNEQQANFTFLQEGYEYKEKQAIIKIATSLEKAKAQIKYLKAGVKFKEEIKINELITSSATTLSKIAILEAKNSAKDAEIKGLKDEVKKLTTELATTKETVTKLTNDLAMVETNIASEIDRRDEQIDEWGNLDKRLKVVEDKRESQADPRWMHVSEPPTQIIPPSQQVTDPSPPAPPAPETEGEDEKEKDEDKKDDDQGPDSKHNDDDYHPDQDQGGSGTGILISTPATAEEADPAPAAASESKGESAPGSSSTQQQVYTQTDIINDNQKVVLYTGLDSRAIVQVSPTPETFTDLLLNPYSPGEVYLSFEETSNASQNMQLVPYQSTEEDYDIDGDFEKEPSDTGPDFTYCESVPDFLLLLSDAPFNDEPPSDQAPPEDPVEVSLKTICTHYRTPSMRMKGRIISWKYEPDLHLIAVKRWDGTQYFNLKTTSISSLNQYDVRNLSYLPLLNRHKHKHADYLAYKLYQEINQHKPYDWFRPVIGDRRETLDLVTKEYRLKRSYPTPRCVKFIPLLPLPQDCLSDMSRWFYDTLTGEAVMVSSSKEEILRIIDPYQLMALSKADICKLSVVPMEFHKDERNHALCFINFVGRLRRGNGHSKNHVTFNPTDRQGSQILRTVVKPI